MNRAYPLFNAFSLTQWLPKVWVVMFAFIALATPQPSYAQQAKPAISSVKVNPSVAEQGDVMIVRVKADAAQTVIAQFADQRLQFVPDEKLGSGNYIALMGIDGLAEVGAYTLTITATSTTGAFDISTANVKVRSGRYITERVKLAGKLAELIDLKLNRDEAAEIRAAYSRYSSEQWWSKPFRQPARGRLVSQYGPRRIYNGVDLGSYHGGIDYSAVAGTPVFAAAPGRVALVKQFPIRGNMVIIDHGRGVFTGYCHLSKTLVKAGQMVDIDEQIGAVGTTGRSQGNHLHFELAISGVTVEPSYWMKVLLP